MTRSILAFAAVLSATFILLPKAEAKNAPTPYLCPAPNSKAPLPETLDLATVMHQFRDHLSDADSITTAGMTDPRRPTDAQIRDAISHILGARNCALVAVANYDSALMPGQVLELDPAKQNIYLEAYRKHMQGFADLLLKYAREMREQLVAPVAQRNFREAYQDMIDVRDHAHHGHIKF